MIEFIFISKKTEILIVDCINLFKQSKLKWKL